MYEKTIADESGEAENAAADASDGRTSDDDILDDIAKLLVEHGVDTGPKRVHELIKEQHPDLSASVVKNLLKRTRIERCTSIMGETPISYASHMNLLSVRKQLQPEEETVTTAQQWQERRQHILHNMQVVMGPLPPACMQDVSTREPMNFKVLSEEVVKSQASGSSVRIRRFTFEPEVGDTVDGNLLLPEDPDASDTPRPAVLCPHQTTMDPRVGRDEPAGYGGSAELHYALELAQAGFVTLTIDYPGFGAYEFPAYERGYASVTMKGIWNHFRAVDLLASMPEVDANRIGALGHSLGGHNSLFLAVFDPRIKVIGTSCGYTSFHRYAETMRQGDLSVWAWREKYMPRIAERFEKNPAKMPFEFHEVLAACAPRPMFTNAPTGDKNFDVQGVRHCLNEARKIYRLLGAGNDVTELVTPSAEHDFPRDARASCYKFFEKYL